MATTRIRLRRDTAANWTAVNPVLALAELGFEQDTYKFKIGDGTSTWSVLGYFGGEVVDATGAVNGVVRLAGALGGTAAAPTALGYADAAALATALALKADTSAVALKANAANAALTGIPTAPTAAPDTNTTQLATTAFVIADVNAAIAALTAASITDSGAVGRALVQSATATSAFTALSFGSHAGSFLQADGNVLARAALGAQTQDAFLDDIIAANGVATNGQFFKFNGTNVVADDLPGGGDLLAANNLADVANAATALANLGGAAATGGTMTTKTLAGITTKTGTDLLAASAMAADEIDITKLRNTKTVPASNPSFTFSGAPANGQTWGLELIGDTSARTVTIPSTFDMQTGTTRTSFLMPANAKATIEWRNDGSVNRAWGLPNAVDNFVATVAPTVNDDAGDGFAAGSVWFDTVTRVLYDCYDPSAGAADWRPRGISRQIEKSAAYTFVMADAHSVFLHPSADTTARIWTIPANSAVAFPIGVPLTFVNQDNAGALTIAITTDIMRFTNGTTGSRTIAENGIATALKLTATEWLISGVNVT
jgi:hypothetical protein